MTTEETRAVAAVPDTGPVAGSAPPPDDDVLAPPVPRRAPLMLLLGLVFFFGPAVAFAGGARPHQIENRPLTAFPSVDKGWPFLDGLNSWANDHLPLRGKAISANTRLSESVFGQPPQYGGSTSGALGVVAPTDTGRKPGGRQYPRVVAGKDGWLFFGGDMSGACAPKASLDTTLAGLDRFTSMVQRSGRKVVFVVAPDKSTLNPDKLPSSYLGDDCMPAAKKRFWDKLTASPPTGYVDIKSPLEALRAKGTPGVWRPSDTHWAGLGAAVYVQRVVDAIQPGLWRPSELVATGPSQALGDLSVLLGTPKKDTLPGYDLRRPGVTVTSQTTTHLASTSTGAPLITGRTLVLGDSFTQASKPFLAAFFQDARVLHPQTAVASPGAVVNAVLGAQTVVLEIVERSVDGGDVPITDPRFLSQLETALRR